MCHDQEGFYLIIYVCINNNSPHLFLVVHILILSIELIFLEIIPLIEVNGNLAPDVGHRNKLSINDTDISGMQHASGKQKRKGKTAGGQQRQGQNVRGEKGFAYICTNKQKTGNPAREPTRERLQQSYTKSAKKTLKHQNTVYTYKKNTRFLKTIASNNIYLWVYVTCK